MAQTVRPVFRLLDRELNSHDISLISKALLASPGKLITRVDDTEPVRRISVSPLKIHLSPRG